MKPDKTTIAWCKHQLWDFSSIFNHRKETVGNLKMLGGALTAAICDGSSKQLNFIMGIEQAYERERVVEYFVRHENMERRYLPVPNRYLIKGMWKEFPINILLGRGSSFENALYIFKVYASNGIFPISQIYLDAVGIKATDAFIEAYANGVVSTNTTAYSANKLRKAKEIEEDCDFLKNTVDYSAIVFKERYG